MNIYLIRHAQVASNLLEINFNSRKQEGLTIEGKKQAEKLAKKLSRLKIDKVFVSKSRRSLETIRPFLDISGADYSVDARLNEGNFGIFNGLTLKEAERKYPEIYQKRLHDKYNFKIPRGESFKDIALRLESFFDDLEKEGRNNLSIVTHATPLKIFLVHFLGYELSKAEKINFKNGSVSSFKRSRNKFKAVKINDYSYLNK